MAANARQVVELDTDGYVVYTYSTVAEFKKALNIPDSAGVRKKIDGIHYEYKDEYDRVQHNRELKKRLMKDLNIRPRQDDVFQRTKDMNKEIDEEPAEEEAVPEDIEEPVEEQEKDSFEEAETTEKRLPVDIEAIDLIEARDMGYHIGAAITCLTAADGALDKTAKQNYVSQAISILGRYVLYLHRDY